MEKTIKTVLDKVNDSIAVKMTMLFGSIWCVYAFLVFSLVPLAVPAWQNTLLYVSNCIQLVALPALMVGNAVLSRGADAGRRKIIRHCSKFYQMCGKNWQTCGPRQQGWRKAHQPHWKGRRWKVFPFLTRHLLIWMTKQTRTTKTRSQPDKPFPAHTGWTQQERQAMHPSYQCLPLVHDATFFWRKDTVA